MNIRLLAVLVTLSSSNLSAQTDSLWSNIISDTLGGFFNSISEVSTGGFVAGGFESIPDADSTIFRMTKLDPFGDIEWAVSYGGSGSDHVQAYETMDGGYAIGGEGDPWLIKTDASGSELWRKGLSTINEHARAYAFALTPDSGYVVVGEVDSSTNARYAFVSKTDKLGVPQWTRLYRGDVDQSARIVTTTMDGGYAVAGDQGNPDGTGNEFAWVMKIDAEGDTVWNTIFGADTTDAEFRGISQTPDSGFALIGKITLTPNLEGSRDHLYVAKADKNGGNLWDSTFGSGHGSEGTAVVNTTNGGITFLGYSVTDSVTDNIDAWLIHTDQDGVVGWNSFYGGPKFEVPFDFVEISDGEYLLAGVYLDDLETQVFNPYLLRLGAVIVNVDAFRQLPSAFELSQNYPNPFNPTTSIRFQVPYDVEGEIAIYDILGRDVVTLVAGQLSAGYGNVTWLGRDAAGRAMPSGVYFARMVADDYAHTVKMVLLK